MLRVHISQRQYILRPLHICALLNNILKSSSFAFTFLRAVCQLGMENYFPINLKLWCHKTVDRNTHHPQVIHCPKSRKNKPKDREYIIKQKSLLCSGKADCLQYSNWELYFSLTLGSSAFTVLPNYYR